MNYKKWFYFTLIIFISFILVFVIILLDCGYNLFFINVFNYLLEKIDCLLIIAVSIFVTFFTYIIYSKQSKFIEEQNSISKEQTKISTKQTELMNEQKTISAKQISISKEQNAIFKEQTTILTKQIEITEQQNKIDLFKEKLKIYQLLISFDKFLILLFQMEKSDTIDIYCLNSLWKQLADGDNSIAYLMKLDINITKAKLLFNDKDMVDSSNNVLKDLTTLINTTQREGDDEKYFFGFKCLRNSKYKKIVNDFDKKLNNLLKIMESELKNTTYLL